MPEKELRVSEIAGASLNEKERQQARLDSIGYAERMNRGYLRRVRLRDYQPGQANYNLGDYPARVSAAPTEYDRALLPKLKKMGVEILQLHEEWNDPMRFRGGDKFTSPDPQGLKDFIALCHENGLKVLAYVSSGYFAKDDPDWREEFARKDFRWNFNCFSYTEGCHGSSAWRAFLLPRTLKVMDEYGFDGIYNDWGYDGYTPGEDQDCRLHEGAYDAEVEDFLSQIYSAVKARGGIYKLHCDRNNRPPCRDRVCDYLWIGEFASGLGAGKDYPCYVVPCQDRHFDDALTLKEYLPTVLPFLQFPLLKTGRPVKGDNIGLPGIRYYGGDEQEFFGKVHAYESTHPDGPHLYSLWSSIPDDPEEWDVWAHAMDLYRPMVTENSLAYLELHDSSAFRAPLPEGAVASMFVNERVYLLVSALGETDAQIELDGAWTDRETGETADSFTVRKGTVKYLVKN